MPERAATMPPPEAAALRPGRPAHDEVAALRLEVEALRLANAALEGQLLAGAEQAESMFAALERQRNELRGAHARELSLGAFAQRIMDTVGGVVIVVDPEGLLRQCNRHCQAQLAPLAEGGSVDVLLHPDDQAALAAALPPLPWPVRSVLFESLRRLGQYRAEHRLAMRDGSHRYHLVEAALLYSAQGKEEGAVISGTDISALKAQELELRASEARFKQAEQVARAGSWELDVASGAMRWSDEMARLLGRAPGEPASLAAFAAAVHPDDRGSVICGPSLALSSGAPCELEFRLASTGGPERWAHLRATLFHDAAGAPVRAVGTLQDISARRQAEEEMRLAASVFDNSLNAILLADAQGRIRKVNRAFTEITGYSAEEVQGQNTRIMKSGEHPPEFYAAMWEQLRTSFHWEGELLNRHKDGQLISVWESIVAVRDAAGEVTHHIGIFYDISEQKAAAQRIHQLAYYDALTGLPNRTLLMDRCQHALARAAREGERLAVLFLDLDRFKHFNDSLGHPVGDALLQAVAPRLQQVLRGSDTVARLGGDEFVVLLEDVETAANAQLVARRIVEAFKAPFELGELSLTATTTVGVSLYPDHGTDVTSLFKYADLALYQGKESGRGDFRIFETRFNDAARQRMHLENELRQALLRNELALHYQPLLSLGDGRLAGAEALLRWTHPELGSVSPAHFIPVAEDSGLIVPIGAWVLEQACHQARRWLDDGLPLGVMAVNLSALQIQRDDLVATVANALTLSGLPAQHLELEISEAYILRHAERDLRQLARLRELGVSLALDDFGTGQTSLGHLRRLPVGKLKIDRAFMADIDRDPAGATVTRAIIGLGHGLGMTVLAEGVETEAQEALLRAQGCDQVQGFRYSRPLPAAGFEAFVWGRSGRGDTPYWPVAAPHVV
jgi:diguanylate cyclase (GGDEF)-like protein/PAS domain S-box-containing protein